MIITHVRLLHGNGGNDSFPLADLRLAAAQDSLIEHVSARAGPGLVDIGIFTVSAPGLAASTVAYEFVERVLVMSPKLRDWHVAAPEDGTASLGALVEMRVRGNRPLMVWAHGISGRTGIFRPFVPRLSQTFDIYGLENHAASASTSIEQMGAQYAAAIHERRPSGPCEIFGYSLGGLVALETARQLVTLGREVTLVGLLDTAPPTVPVAPETLAVAASLVARGLGLEPAAALFTEDPILELSQRAIDARVVPSGLAVSYIKAMVETYIRNGKAADAYRPPVYHNPAALLFAEGGDAVRHRNLWRRFAPNVVAEDIVAMDHFEIIGDGIDAVTDIVEQWQRLILTDRRTPC